MNFTHVRQRTAAIHGTLHHVGNNHGDDMLRSLTDLKKYNLGAIDGDVGHMADLFFDDRHWLIRYLVVDTGSWLAQRKVLISPFSLGEANWTRLRLPVRLSREQVRNSPDVDTDQPVSRQHEVLYADYYDYPYYWRGAGLWGDGFSLPGMMPPDDMTVASPWATRSEAQKAFAHADAVRRDDGDPHLRSCHAVIGYHVHATDGHIGHLQGMLVDEEVWAIRYLVVNTSNWWLGHEVLIPTDWITSVSWDESEVTVDMTRLAIQGSPAYNPDVQPDRRQEVDFFNHYDRPAYWANESSSMPPQAQP